MANSNLAEAKKAKNDEFYTQYPDIEKEVSATHDKTVNVDDLEWHYLDGDGDFRSPEIKKLF